MAAIDISSAGGGGSVATGVLQLQNGVALDATLRFVTDQSNTLSPLKLSTTLVQTLSTLKITTADNPYIDAEDNSGNNRFTIGRDPSSQQVNLDFASNPTGSTTNVGAIRTYVDGVNLSEVMTFREDGRLQVGSTSASAMYWDNTNNRLGISTNAPINKLTVIDSTSGSTNGAIGITVGNSNTANALSFGSYFNIGVISSPSGALMLQTPASNKGVSISTGYLIPTAMAHIQGSGSTSATTSLLVQDSAGTQTLKVDDAGKTTGIILNASSKLQITALDMLDYGGGLRIQYNASPQRTTLFTNLSGGGMQWYASGSCALGNSTTEVTSAVFNTPSTTKGFLPPVMTTAQKNAIGTPAAGLIIYDTDLNKLCVRGAANWETITSI